MIEQQVTHALDALGIPYGVMPIDPDYADTAAFCERYGVSLTNSCNTIIVGSKTAMASAVQPSTWRA